MEETRNPQYPFEIASLVRKNKTFAVEARFSQEKEDHFLKVHNHFSRFVFTVIVDGKAAIANIPLNILEGLKIKSEEILRQSVAEEAKPVSTAVSPAYTFRFAGGTLKGKTPVEILLENKDDSAEDPFKKGKEILNKQYLWLKESAEKNPKFADANKKGMAAISEASKIPVEDLSAMNASSASGIGHISLIDIKTRPLMNRDPVNGKNFVYEINVSYTGGKDYPINVTVDNYYAPVKKLESGLLNVMVGEKDNDTAMTKSFDMTLEEWLHVVRMMDEADRGYYFAHAASAFKLAEDADRKRKEEAKKEKESKAS